MFRFLFLYKDTLLIRLKPCAIWEVWAYPLRIEQTFSTPKIYRQKAKTTGNSKKWQNINFPKSMIFGKCKICESI